MPINSGFLAIWTCRSMHRHLLLVNFQQIELQLPWKVFYLPFKPWQKWQLCMANFFPRKGLSDFVTFLPDICAMAMVTRTTLYSSRLRGKKNYKKKHPKNWETALWGKERLYWKKGFVKERLYWKKGFIKERLYWNKGFIEIKALLK